MKRSPNLAEQGLILVGVPISLMLVFLITLLFLFLKVEKEATETDHSKTIISKANSLVKQYYDAASQLIIYKHARTDEARETFQKQLQGTEESFVDLKELLKGDAVELRMLEKLKKVAEVGMSFMRKYERYIAREEKLTPLEVAILYKEFDMSGTAFTSKLQDLVAHETARHHASSIEEKNTRTFFKIWIFVGALLAIGLGILLAVVFTKNTTSRLALLMDNTVRLGRKERLLPQLTGTDEISQLDLFFHKMADDLAEATRKERAILDNAVDVICSIDEDGKFKAANPATLQTWGYEPEKLIGMHFSEILLKDDLRKFEEAIAQSKEHSLINVENRVVSQSKNLVHTLWSLKWSQSENSLFCVAHDINDRKEVEKLKQEFIAVISHELRTPLTSLQMTLTLLLNGNYGSISEGAEQRLKSAENGISRLIGLINDLLDIEKMEAGKLSMRYADTDLISLLTKATDSVQGFAEQHAMTISCLPSKEKIKVLVDPDRILQVIVNLLSNAIKFSPEGGSIQVRVEDCKEFSEVQVVDHGSGVPSGYEEAIFRKYEQAHVSKEKKTRGTGLGLPICKAIIEQHGGSIGVTATDGGGSTFWFRIPHEEEEVLTPEELAALEEMEA